jgi:hypothetical protein
MQQQPVCGNAKIRSANRPGTLNKNILPTVFLNIQMNSAVDAVFVGILQKI